MFGNTLARDRVVVVTAHSTQRRIVPMWAAPLLALGLLLLAAAGVRAETLVAVTADDRLVWFDSATPGTITRTLPLGGLVRGDSVVGLDARPANGQLVAMTAAGRLYTISPETGMATAIGSGAIPGLTGTAFDFDFNPTVDRIRLVTDTGQNLRLHPDTAAVAATDGMLTYAMGDANAGQPPMVVAAAYTNNMAGASSTTLYVIDARLGTLATQNPPNDGVLNTVGRLGVLTSGMLGFDIGSRDAAYIALTAEGTLAANLYHVDLGSGAATLVGPIGQGLPVRALAAVLPAPAAATMPAGR